MGVSVSKCFFDQYISISQGQLSDHRGSSSVQRFHFPFMCGVSKTKSMFQASLKNGLLLLLVPLGCYPAGSTHWRFKKNPDIFLANHGWTCVVSFTILLCKDFDGRGAAELCILAILQKQGKTEAQGIQSIEESWLLQSNFFLQVLLYLQICPVIDIHKDRQGTIRGFCWTLYIVLPSWTWHLTQYLIPVPNIL